MLQSYYVVVHLEQDKNKNEQYVLNENTEPHERINYLLLLLKLLTYILTAVVSSSWWIENLDALIQSLGRVRFANGKITLGNRQYNKPDKAYYRRVCQTIDGTQHHFFVHRLVCFAFHGDSHRIWLDSCDHINQKSEDNRASNLRFTTNQLNLYNTSKSVGYTPRGKKFQAQIKYNGKRSYKTFKTAQEARAWYLAKRAECVQKCEQELADREVWFQNLKLVHNQLCDGLE